ncbi:MAG TPA: hypothetical protein VHA13_04490 [Gammaproteobacteria bacterium]|nr:hypothetical protein [Gammaproteobacteria bacterium]
MQEHFTSLKNGKKPGQYDFYSDIEKIKAAIAETTGDAKNKAQEVLLDSLNKMQEKYGVAQKAAETYVTDNPFKTMAATLAAGFVLGLLFRKK